MLFYCYLLFLFFNNRGENNVVLRLEAYSSLERGVSLRIGAPRLEAARCGEVRRGAPQGARLKRLLKHFVIGAIYALTQRTPSLLVIGWGRHTRGEREREIPAQKGIKTGKV